jgi:hypothetical protein
MTCEIDIYTLFKDILTAGAAFGAVAVAKEGLTTWKKQLTGSNEYELSRKLLRSVYQFRDSIRGVRSPIVWPSEMQSDTKGETGQQIQDRFAGISFAYERRWRAVIEASANLEVDLLESEILWDSTLKNECKALWSLQGELYAYLDVWLRAQDSSYSVDLRLSYQETLKSMRSIIYERQNQDDDFSNEISKAIVKIEDVLKPHLHR